jgi:phosphoribosylformylglycinamidine synthase
MKLKIGVVVFPGSNCDQDMVDALSRFPNTEVFKLWHKNTELHDADLIVLPGGFSYGDYLRSGAIARFSPVMESVQQFAAKGGYVLGVCNGFQILCEGGLLPGVLMRNKDLRFICKMQHLRVERADTDFTRAYTKNQIIKVAIAHGEGNYEADDETIKRLEGEGRVAFRYCDEKGVVGGLANPNGSTNDIAGIYSDKRNVLGMMPHPENLIDPLVGGIDGAGLFKSLVAA